MGLEVEGHLVPTDHRQWAAMGAEEDADDHPHHEEDGEEGAGEEAGEGVEAAILATGHAHTRGLEADHHGGACHDHLTAGHRQGHHHVAEEAEAMGGETLRREEGDEVVGGGEARVMIHTTVHDLAAEAGTADRKQPS